MRLRIFVAVGVAAMSASLLAQAPADRPAFEVISIKADPAPLAGGSEGFRPGGLFESNLWLIVLLQAAFRRPTGQPFQQDQIIGLPQWARGARYDITAKVPADEVASLTQDRESAYVRSMLEDRFALKAHVEERDMPVYALNVATGGTKLRPTTVDCTVKPGTVPPCLPQIERGHFSGHMPINALLGQLSMAAGRLVVDHTNLAGRFDIDLQWNPGPLTSNSADDRPPIFAAVREQLGLTLDATQAPIDVLVIDHVERPTED